MKILYCDHDLIKDHIAEALVMSGLPKMTNISGIGREITKVRALEIIDERKKGFEKFREDKNFKRGKTLGAARPNSGHDCFLKGCVVTAIISAPGYQWPQIQRYHFLDIISSQSKMHRITKMDLRAQTNEEVDDVIINLLNDYVDKHNNAETPEERKKYFRKIINNCPHGLHLAAGIVTNYLQLKTMYLQRKNHPLEEWANDFIRWVESLPYFKELTGVE